MSLADELPGKYSHHAFCPQSNRGNWSPGSTLCMCFELRRADSEVDAEIEAEDRREEKGS